MTFFERTGMDQGSINNMNTESITTEPVVTEQVAVTETGPVFKTEEPKKGKGMLLGLVFCLILAIGGIGFGVWAMMDGNARADKLNKQIADLNAQIASMGEQGDDETEEDTANYIYVGEYGIKIKKPEKVENKKYMISEYTFYEGYPQAVDYLEIREDSTPGAGVDVFVSDEVCEEGYADQYHTCFSVGDKSVKVAVPMGETNPAAGINPAVSEEFLEYFFDSENYSEI